MEGIFMKYGTEIFFGLVSAGALAFCKYLHKKMKEYQAIIEEREQDETEHIVDAHLEPVINDIEELSFLDFYNGGFDSGVITGKNEIREFVETYSNRNEITLHPLGLDDFDKLLEENGCI
jgi:hypothetical protein